MDVESYGVLNFVTVYDSSDDEFTSDEETSDDEEYEESNDSDEIFTFFENQISSLNFMLPKQPKFRRIPFKFTCESERIGVELLGYLTQCKRQMPTSNATKTQLTYRACVEGTIDVYGETLMSFFPVMYVHSDGIQTIEPYIKYELTLQRFLGLRTSMEITWSHVLVVLTFTLLLQLHYEDNGEQELACDTAYFLARFVREYFLEFLDTNGGWDGICLFYQSLKDESNFEFLVSTSCIGIGILAVMYAAYKSPFWPSWKFHAVKNVLTVLLTSTKQIVN